MRTRFKVLSTILAVIFVITSFASAVAAGTDEKAYWKSMSTDYYYNQMTASEKKFYDRLDERCMYFLLNTEDTEGVLADYGDLGLSEDDMLKVQFLFQVSNPQYFFIDAKYVYNSSSFCFEVFEEFRNGSARASARDTVKKCINGYISAASSASRPEAKEHIVITKIYKEVKRDLDPNADQNYYQSLYSAVLGKTKCRGFTMFFAAIMNAMGIRCISVTRPDHAWNIIYLHGYWYNVDVTNFCQELFMGYDRYNTNLNLGAYEQTYNSLLPEVKYDSLDNKAVQYTSRYTESGGVTYFVVSDDSSERLVVPVAGTASSLPSKITYNNNEYNVIQNTSSLAGWKTENGKWYYINSNGSRATGWLEVKGKWYYFDQSGYMVTGWKQSGSSWYYFDDNNGDMVTGWRLVGGIWYYFNGSGAMVTGWQQIGGVWYYFSGSGAMLKGWQSLGGVWYYFNGGGAMVTGWQQIGGKWYYFESSGAMKTGWLKSGNSWYYLKSSGEMLTGWYLSGSTWYYFSGSGAMVTGTQTIGGVTYRFDSSGKCLNPNG